jgi:hypothetical protein
MWLSMKAEYEVREKVPVNCQNVSGLGQVHFRKRTCSDGIGVVTLVNRSSTIVGLPALADIS